MSLRKFGNDENVDATYESDGVGPLSQKEYTGHDTYKNVSRIKDDQIRYGWQTFLFAPANRPAGTTSESAPSAWSYVLAFLWTMIACLVSGFIYIYIVDRGLAAAPADNFMQGVVFALISSLLAMVFMSFSVSPHLKTHISFGALMSQVGTFDLGLVTALAFAVVQFAGFALGGLAMQTLIITSNLGNATGTCVLPNPTDDYAGYWLYWFGPMFAIMFYTFARKFYSKEVDQTPKEVAKRNSKAILVFGALTFLFTMVFRPSDNFYMDGGMYFAALVACKGLGGNFAQTRVVDWAYYIFVPIASVAGAMIMYWVLKLLTAGSDNYNEKRISSEYKRRQ